MKKKSEIHISCSTSKHNRIFISRNPIPIARSPRDSRMFQLSRHILGFVQDALWGGTADFDNGLLQGIKEVPDDACVVEIEPCTPLQDYYENDWLVVGRCGEPYYLQTPY